MNHEAVKPDWAITGSFLNADAFDVEVFNAEPVHASRARPGGLPAHPAG
ncbi:hypothetical protein [Amycolatopsis saalfeldensis]|nr:hypothetical protein [Amycolatopsis saalfeldensis]